MYPVCFVYINTFSFSDTSIRPAVERVLKIWKERKVFDSVVVQKLVDELNNGTVSIICIILFP